MQHNDNKYSNRLMDLLLSGLFLLCSKDVHSTHGEIGQSVNKAVVESDKKGTNESHEVM